MSLLGIILCRTDMKDIFSAKAGLEPPDRNQIKNSEVSGGKSDRALNHVTKNNGYVRKVDQAPFLTLNPFIEK